MVLREVLGLPAALVFLLPSGVAIAQETAQPAAQPAAEERAREIVVTGTRIRRQDPTTPAPVTVITRDRIVASGEVSLGDFLQTLPKQGNAISTSIPTAAIERVEVLKDGASEVYGSDAIAGVVNIITRRGWNGTEVSAYGGTSSRSDEQIYDLNFAHGTSGDLGSVIFGVGLYQQKKVTAGDRDFSRIPVAYDTSAGVYSRAPPRRRAAARTVRGPAPFRTRRSRPRAR